MNEKIKAKEYSAENIKVLEATIYTAVRSGSEVREIITLKFKNNFAAEIAAPKS